jgi:hypothetical protein
MVHDLRGADAALPNSPGLSMRIDNSGEAFAFVRYGGGPRHPA